MAIQEAKQQHPDMLVTKAVVIRETESPTEELQQKAEVRDTVVLLKDYLKSLTGRVPLFRLEVSCWKVNQMVRKRCKTSTQRQKTAEGHKDVKSHQRNAKQL